MDASSCASLNSPSTQLYWDTCTHADDGSHTKSRWRGTTLGSRPVQHHGRADKAQPASSGVRAVRTITAETVDTEHVPLDQSPLEFLESVDGNSSHELLWSCLQATTPLRSVRRGLPRISRASVHGSCTAAAVTSRCRFFSPVVKIPALM